MSRASPSVSGWPRSPRAVAWPRWRWTRAEFVVPVPDQVPSPVAAAAPLMLTTALLLLEDAARFRPGETVLVHSASGGVGSAVAQLVPVLGGGLRIGTVGRPDKVASALSERL